MDLQTVTNIISRLTLLKPQQVLQKHPMCCDIPAVCLQLQRSSLAFLSRSFVPLAVLLPNGSLPACAVDEDPEVAEYAALLSPVYQAGAISILEDAGKPPSLAAPSLWFAD